MATEQHTEVRKHHDFSPSTLQAREASPCYQPRDSDSEASRAGVKQHKAFETGDLSQLTDEQAEAVELCLDYSKGLELPDSIILDENYLGVDDEETTAGYIDRAIIWMRQGKAIEAHILDCKFGKWPVEPAETNLQGICYALGIRQKYPTVERVTVHFMMPYLGYVDSHCFEGKKFPELLLRVRVAVARAKEWAIARGTQGRVVTYFPTTGTCLFCARQGSCEACHSIALNISKKFAPMHTPKELTPMLINDPVEAGHALKLADLMKTWAEATRRQITLRVIEGAPEPEGYHLVESQKRDVKDTKKVAEVAKASFGLADADIVACSKILITHIEDAVQDKAPRRGKKKALDNFRKAIREAGAVEDGAEVVCLRMIRPDDETAE